MKYIVGIDEAGRGPLAGPVTVGVFCASENFKNKLIKILGGTTSLKLRGTSKIKDSKQLSHQKREEIFNEFKKLKLEGKIDFNVAHSSPKMIDRIGISRCIKKCISHSLNKLQLSCDRKNLVIRLDGLLKAPPEYQNQKTIIGGDAKDVFIACASIVAKVSRDRLMCKLAKKYPNYLFEIHKGYGTKFHRELLKKIGLSKIHRLSFCRNLPFLRK